MGCVTSLDYSPAAARTDLLAPPVAAAVAAWAGRTPVDAIRVAEIDPELADTAAFCAAYDEPLAESANCVVVHGRRGETVTPVACLVLATTRADVNGLVRRHVNARKASFAPMEEAVADTGMEYGGITPLGLPENYVLLVDPAVVASSRVVIGSGLRRSKVELPGAAVAEIPGATVLPGLGLPVGG
ncbi:YbaK/EbsC family protein [Sporichthya polymorpha]|uniref:YbaK/EbsC family protein n=1 Tax=Sporichthya polymorpha TaxID=35751 RepID=UPI00052557A1